MLELNISITKNISQLDEGKPSHLPSLKPQKDLFLQYIQI